MQTDPYHKEVNIYRSEEEASRSIVLPTRPKARPSCKTAQVGHCTIPGAQFTKAVI